jgi:LPXTG-motif cell wall-anchored protein
VEKLKELLHEKPWLIWVGLGLLIGLVLLMVRRKSGGATVLPVASAPTPQGPKPVGSGGGAGSGEDSSVGLKGFLESLLTSQAQFQAQSLALQRQQYDRFNESVAGLSASLHQTSTATVTATETTAPQQDSFATKLVKGLLAQAPEPPKDSIAAAPPLPDRPPLPDDMEKAPTADGYWSTVAQDAGAEANARALTLKLFPNGLPIPKK